MAEQKVYEISQNGTTEDFTLIKQPLDEAFHRLTLLFEHGDGTGVTGLPTGFGELDRLTSGLQKSNLVILAARPSMGKTSLALNIAEHVAVTLQKPVALFSLEMSKAEIAQRLLCSVGKVDQSRLRLGQLEDGDWMRVTGAMETLGSAPLYIDDSGAMTVMEMRAKARRLAAKQKGGSGLAMVVVDYIQLMQASTPSDNRVQEISQISRSLKMLARDLDVPVLALSQLSRAVEQRQDKRPVLSDLRESGAIEQDADVVMFIYRDAYYRKSEGEEVRPDDPSNDLSELLVAKHRNGPVGTVNLRSSRATRASSTITPRPVPRASTCRGEPEPRHRRRRRPVGRRGQGQDRRPAGRARARRRALPGRQQRRPHGRGRRREVQAPPAARAGILYPGKLCVIGNGVVLDPEVLCEELDELEARGGSRDGLRISGNAHLVMPWHRVLDQASELRLGALQIGTTRRGIGPTYADKAARVGIRVAGPARREDPAREDRDGARAEERAARLLYGIGRLDAEAIQASAARHAARLAPVHRRRVAARRTRRSTRGERVLFEGAQGTLLDLDHGTYPFVTSSNPIAGAACVGLGIGPTRIDAVAGVAKAYLTRVGEGPFPSEAEAAAADALREAGSEFGTVTGRPRRCGWLDLVGAPLRGARERLHGARADEARRALGGERDPGVRRPTAYGDGSVSEHFPAHQSDFHHAEPVWETLEGWGEPIDGARHFGDLPPAAQRYVAFVAERLGVPVGLVSVGPRRDQVLTAEASTAAARRSPRHRRRRPRERDRSRDGRAAAAGRRSRTRARSRRPCRSGTARRRVHASAGVSGASTASMPRSPSSRTTSARVMPASAPLATAGVSTRPRLTTKRLSAVHSAIRPCAFSSTASSAPWRRASIEASTLVR